MNVMDESKFSVEFSENTENKERKRTRRRLRRNKATVKYLLTVLSIIFITLSVLLLLLWFSSKHSPFRDAGVCYSDECEETAKYLYSNLDESIDPCDDFYRFACNGWIKRHPRPKDEHDWSAIKVLKYDLSKRLIKLLEERNSEKMPLSVRKAKNFFAACNKLELRFEYGVQELKRAFTKIGGFPLITEDWEDEDFDWETAYVYCDTKIPVFQPFFEYEVGYSDNYPYKYIEIKSPTTLYMGYTLLDDSKSKDEKTEKIAMLRNHIKSSISKLYPKLANNDINEDIDAFIKLDTEIGNLSMISDAYNKQDEYVNYTLSELSKKFKDIDWLNIFSKIYKEVNFKLEGNEHILTKNIYYFEKLGELLKKTSKRTLANYIGYYVLREFGSQTIYQLKENYNKTEEAKLQRKCYEVTENFFKVALNYWFVKTQLTDGATEEVKSFLLELKSSLTLTLQNNNWMDDETKMHAQMKLNKMLTYVAMPAEIQSDDDLDKIYAETGFISSENYVNAYKKMLKWRKQTELLRLREDFKEDVYSPSDVNAYYSTTENKIEILSGFLFPPNYFRKSPLAVNFAAVGTTIGHEITHGFDREGSKYDHKGELVNWWNTETQRIYKQKVECFINQYSNFKYKPINSSINGKRTVSENIADNGALHQAFLAYKMHSAIKNVEQDLRLPLKMTKFTKEQLFFIAFASSYCSNHSSALVDDIMKDEHSPDAARVIVPLSNSNDFAKAFRCKPGSIMNPVDKCSLW